MSINYVYHTFLTGTVPAETTRIHFSDYWVDAPAAIESDVAYSGQNPVPCDLSWQVWLDGHGYVSHPLGEHQITAQAYDVNDNLLKTYSVVKNLTSTGTFTLGSNVGGTGYPGLPPLELPTGYSGAFPSIPWWNRTVTLYEPGWPDMPQGFYANWPDGYLNDITFTASDATEPLKITGFANTSGSMTVTPIYPYAEYGLNYITIDNTATVGSHTFTVTGTDIETSHTLPLNLVVYDSYRWYYMGLNYTSLYNTSLNTGACTQYHIFNSSPTLNAAASIQATSVPVGWTVTDDSFNDLTIETAISSSYKEFVILITPPDLSTAAENITFTVKDGNDVPEDRTLLIETYNTVVSYPPSQDIPDQFSVFISFNYIDSGYGTQTVNIGAELGQNFDGWTMSIDGQDILAGAQTFTLTGETSQQFEIVAIPGQDTAVGDATFNIISYPGGKSGIFSGVVQSSQITVTK